MRGRDDYSWLDGFAGAGGSSTGIHDAGGRVGIAINHWPLAVDVHAANFRTTDHLCADISQHDPRRVPHTTFAWFSPECTWHSGARGKRVDEGADLFGETLPSEAAQRSRSTMWDVVRFTEVHRYAVVLVENVVEVRNWPPYAAWLAAMAALGYRHRELFVNAMHAQHGGLPAPQSRDRIYVAFVRKGVPMPDFDAVIRPPAWCPRCATVVDSRQAWKPGRAAGKYRAQYVYTCTGCGDVVEPGWLPAAAAIDWGLPGRRIGDRARPLADKTRARIAAGIARYWGPLTVEAAGNTYDAADPKHPRYGDPSSYYRAWPTSDPLMTLHTTASKALVVPVEGRDGKQAQPVSDPLRTMTTRAESGLAYLPFIAELRGGGSVARPASDPLATVTASGNHHGLVMPYYGTGVTAPVTDPLGTVTTRDRFALLSPAGGTWNTEPYPTSAPLRATTTRDTTALITAEDAAAMVDDCLFRMLEPSEVAAGMAFPGDYQWLGTRRERVRMAGNAVCPPVSRDLAAAVHAALDAV